MSYQDDDAAIIEYGIIPLPAVQRRVRGPLPRNLDSGGYVCGIGAAQTFGRFVPLPFLDILRRDLGIETLNLGFAGAGPDQHLKNRGVLELANRASVVILQVMSGRSISNSYFENVFADQVRPWGSAEQPVHAATAYSRLLREKGEGFVRDLVQETRANYIRTYRDLMEAIRVPVILFWFSQRTPHYDETYIQAGPPGANGFFGDFPHLIDQAVIDALKPDVAAYAECVSSRGMPQTLISRYTGEVVNLKIVPNKPGLNPYYPSPEMHEDAARVLRPEVAAILARRAAK